MQRTEGAPERRWQNRAVHREIDARRVRQLWKLVVALIVAAAPTAVYLIQQNESVKIEYELNDLQTERERLREERRQLGLERSRLESLGRIEAWATRDQGLVRPGPQGVVMVREASTGSEELVASSPSGSAGAVR